MRRLAATAPRPLVYALAEAVGGPGHCFSCMASLDDPDAYGRCGPCEDAAEIYYRRRMADEPIEVIRA
jgi:hypothetical protein